MFAVRDVRVLREQRPQSQRAETTVRRRSRSARATQPTIEDVGEARLANGSAYVPLDRAFAATVDPNAPYLAFVTAEGDTRGLYVAQLDARIFPLHRTDLKPLAPPARPAMLR